MTENKQKLPEDWKEVALIDVLAKFETGKRPKGGVAHIQDGIPSLGGEHLNKWGDFKFDKIKYVPKDFALSMNRGHLEVGDVLVVKDGATTGKTSIVKDTFPYSKAVINEHVFLCRANKTLANSEYIFWYLWSYEGQEKILSNKKGSAQGGINTKFAKNVKFPLPPLSEQERIVARLDQLLGEAANYRQLLAQLPKKIEQFRQSVLARAISGELSAAWRAAQGLNKDWEEKALKHLGKWLGGGTPRKSEPKFWTEGNVLWISAKDVKAWFLEDSKDKITEEAIVGSSVKLIAANSILFVVRSGILRRTFPIAMNLRETTINQDLKALEPHANIESKYLFYALKGKEQELRSDCMKHGTTVESVDFKKLKDFLIPLPPLAEQKEIVARVEALLAQADALSDYYERAMAGAEQLPQTILAKAFRGEL